MKVLDQAEFVAHDVVSGNTVGVSLKWRSTATANLVMHYPTDVFTIDPSELTLEPSDGSKAIARDIRVTRLKGGLDHCDVQFVFGSDHIDSVKVT
jgi:hypothetical protein